MTTGSFHLSRTFRRKGKHYVCDVSNLSSIVLIGRVANEPGECRRHRCRSRRKQALPEQAIDLPIASLSLSLHTAQRAWPQFLVHIAYDQLPTHSSGSLAVAKFTLLRFGGATTPPNLRLVRKGRLFAQDPPMTTSGMHHP